MTLGSGKPRWSGTPDKVTITTRFIIKAEARRITAKKLAQEFGAARRASLLHRIAAMGRTLIEPIYADLRARYPELASYGDHNLRNIVVGTTGRDAGSGSYVRMRQRDERLADGALRLVWRCWRCIGQELRADLLADFAWQAGCRDPEVTEAHAIAVAAGGHEPDLVAAIGICDEALRLRQGSTEDAWGSIATRRALLDGRLERRRFRGSGKFDADGNEIPARQHRPSAPVRRPRTRFLRQAAL